jgi:hypothetical protein
MKVAVLVVAAVAALAALSAMIRRAAVSTGPGLAILPLNAFAAGAGPTRSACPSVVAVTVETGTTAACRNDDPITQQFSTFTNIARSATAARAGVVRLNEFTVTPTVIATLSSVCGATYTHVKRFVRLHGHYRVNATAAPANLRITYAPAGRTVGEDRYLRYAGRHNKWL